jgi:tetratricopeptide (TPR) repeat protein
VTRVPARALLAAAVAAALLPACAYFNSLYNARRQFADARRAEARGQPAAAATAYRAAIDKAAASYRRDSTGHWSNDALELIGRSYFALGDYPRARAAFGHMLERPTRGERRAAAQAYLGAALVRSGMPAPARAPLDSAVARLGARSELGAFARLWRARARFATGNAGGAWADLDAAAGTGGPLGVDAGLEAGARAVAGRDSARAATAFAALLDESAAAAQADSVRALGRAASRVWPPAVVRGFLAPLAHRRWDTVARLEMSLFRASLAAQAGDTATAQAEAAAVARGASRAVADRARVLQARWRLAEAGDLATADAVRAELLPAITDSDARDLIRGLKMLDIMVNRASQGEPLSLFAGAELARDQLGAPVLARRLFLAYADMVPGAQWAPKALMAAAQLADSAGRDSIGVRLRDYAASVYVRAGDGADVDSAFSDAEARLGSALSAAVAYAATESARRDAGVTHVVAVLDSIQAQARTDSLRIACGAFADSLGIAGARGDSLRAACVAGDTAKVALLRKPDTMKLADSVAVRAPVTRPGLRGVTRDSIN